MPPARTMPIIDHLDTLHAAAAAQERVRIQGVITDTGQERRGGYRTAWLLIDTLGTSVRITASPDSQLGRAHPGDTLDLAVNLTGILDLTTQTYLASHAQLLTIR